MERWCEPLYATLLFNKVICKPNFFFCVPGLQVPRRQVADLPQPPGDDHGEQGGRGRGQPPGGPAAPGRHAGRAEHAGAPRPAGQQLGAGRVRLGQRQLGGATSDVENTGHVWNLKVLTGEWKTRCPSIFA